MKELPSIISLNRRDDELDNRDSILLNSMRQAADETLNNAAEVSSANFAKPTNTSSTGGTGNAAPLTAPPSSSTLADTASQTGAQNLEVVIMQKLLKHEKKATSTSSHATDSPVPDSSSTSNSPKSSGSSVGPVSSISITKKRPIDNVDSAFKQLSTGSSSSSSNEYKNGFYHQSNGISNRRNFDENEIFTKKRKLNNGG